MHPFSEYMDKEKSYQHISCVYVDKIFQRQEHSDPLFCPFGRYFCDPNDALHVTFVTKSKNHEATLQNLEMQD